MEVNTYGYGYSMNKNEWQGVIMMNLSVRNQLKGKVVYNFQGTANLYKVNPVRIPCTVLLTGFCVLC